MKSGFGNWELNDFPAGSHAGFVAGPGIQPRSPGSIPTPWAARPVLSSVSRDPREHWHFSKSAGNSTLFCLEWFTFFHLIPTLKISSFLFSPSNLSKTYWICRCGGTHVLFLKQPFKVSSGCLFYSNSCNPQSDIKQIFLFNLCMKHSLSVLLFVRICGFN